jgi:hypothetical protein
MTPAAPISTGTGTIRDFLLANDTAMPMELLPTSPTAKRRMLVLDRLIELRAAAWVAAVVIDFVCSVI